MVIVVATDQHLGYDRSNADDFSHFLNTLSKRNDVTDFVLLGDFIDMWRRDVSGLFLEFKDILQQVLDLRSTMHVYCIAGNHDYHLLKFSLDENPYKKCYSIQFLDKLDLPLDNPKYLFRHGWEFDPLQHPELMEILCYNLSDTNGKLRSEVWDALTKSIKNEVIGEVEKIFGKVTGKNNYLETILMPPRDRLKTTSDLVENNACKYEKNNGQILVFGHTHRPFVNTDCNVVNAGSWVSDAEISNTYVELDGDKTHLMQYNDGNPVEITTRQRCPN